MVAAFMALVFVYRPLTIRKTVHDWHRSMTMRCGVGSVEFQELVSVGSVIDNKILEAFEWACCRFINSYSSTPILVRSSSVNKPAGRLAKKTPFSPLTTEGQVCQENRRRVGARG